jgi:lysophospholipase L1-like esterase
MSKMMRLKHVVILKAFVASVLLLGSQSACATTKKPIRIACVGDSITYGDRLGKRRITAAYPAQLQGLLGDGYRVENYGVGGMIMREKTKKDRKQNSYWNAKKIPLIKEFKPNIVIIMLGTNDAAQAPHDKYWHSREAFVKSYLKMVKLFKSLPSHPTVYICYPPPPFHDKRWKREKVMESEILPGIAEVSKKMHVKIIDLYAPFEGKPKLFVDGIHPNPKGQALIAKTIYPHIKSTK